MATKNAAELAERLGEGWKPRVWENMGWYYSAFKGVVQVHPPGPQATLDPTYICFCNTTPQFTSRDPDPIQAVELAIKDLDSFIAHIQTQRANLNGVIKRA